MGALRTLAGSLARRLGLRAPLPAEPPPPPDFDATLRAVIERVQPFTMTSPERLHETCAAVEHVVRHGVPGAVVECGTWRGGSTMAMALTLLRLGDRDREIWVYDTFEGMTEPGEADVSPIVGPARETWLAAGGREGGSSWCHADIREVQANLASTGLDMARVRLVRGPVESTIPESMPDRIAVLRLDTDWYESTRHELRHLFPRLERGGLLVVDDYGHWEGARRAVDEYLRECGVRMFLARTDYTGRIGVKE
jgi:predicted O-methyltransferase YrrM